MRAPLWRGGHCIEKYEPLFIGLIPCPLEVNGPFLFSFDVHWARCECRALYKLHAVEINSVPPSLSLAKATMNEGEQHSTLFSIFHHSLCLISLQPMFIFWLWVRNWSSVYLKDRPSMWAWPAREDKDQILEYSGHSVKVCQKNGRMNGPPFTFKPGDHITIIKTNRFDICNICSIIIYIIIHTLYILPWNNVIFIYMSINIIMICGQRWPFLGRSAISQWNRQRDWIAPAVKHLCCKPQHICDSSLHSPLHPPPAHTISCLPSTFQGSSLLSILTATDLLQKPLKSLPLSMYHP